MIMAQVRIYAINKLPLGTANYELEEDERAPVSAWLDGHPVKGFSVLGGGWISLHVNWFDRGTGQSHTPVLIRHDRS